MKRTRKKWDLILAGSLLVVAAVLYVFFRVTNSADTPANFVEARVDGELIGRWPLSEPAELDLDTKYGHNHISIADGRARMTEADCPDGYCMLQTPLGAENAPTPSPSPTDQDEGQNGSPLAGPDAVSPTDPGNSLLVCLPHHLVVELVEEGDEDVAAFAGEDEAQVDTVAS